MPQGPYSMAILQTVRYGTERARYRKYMYPACEPPHRLSTYPFFRAVEESKSRASTQSTYNLAHKNGHLYVGSKRDAKVKGACSLKIVITTTLVYPASSIICVFNSAHRQRSVRKQKGCGENKTFDAGSEC
jgi:hypothetical protein